ncbi:hypothetical protein FRC08_011061 [Ceratobasidium sp. 394]|nr:hypothetical protein FRC08_011061 [Ceratobasidium sp. 394]
MMSTTISLANSQGTKVPENMPEREQQMNDIQATTFIWTGCHQRQFRDLCGSGILVQAFTSIPQTNFATPTSGLITCGDLFRRISDILATRPSGITSPQLYQLWTSAEDQLANLMELPVTL